MKRIVSIVLSLILVFGLALAVTGCSDDTENTTGTTTSGDETTTTTDGDSNETTSPSDSDPVDVEIMTGPWVGTPLPENDPYKQWLDETFNANFTLRVTPEFSQEILTRFAANDPPDIFDLNKNDLYRLYDQAVLLEDWNPYLNNMPTTAENIGDLAATYYTQDGKLICLPAKPGQQKWSFNYRQDWMENLGLPMPETVEELLDVARAFTNDDPTGEGEVTYAFTSAGGGESLGDIGNFQSMFGPMDFYIGSDGSVNHPILDGNHKEFMDFMKTIVDEELIDPDWYTQGWNERKPNLYKGMFGFVWYPPMALLTETDVARENDGVVLDWYDVLPMPSGSSVGGKLPPLNPIGVLRTASAVAAEDTAKWEVIMNYFEETAYPNDGYFKLRWGVEIDGFEMIPLEGEYYYIDLLGPVGKHARGERENQSLGLYDWGKTIVTYGDNIMTGSTPEPDELVFRTVEMEQAIEQVGRHPQEQFLLDLDPDILEEVNRIKNEFEINFILGQANDYDSFRASWLAGGGQTLLDEAISQFTAQGLIN